MPLDTPSASTLYYWACLMADPALATYELLPNQIKVFTILHPNEASIRQMFRLMEQHLAIRPHPEGVPQRILVDTRGHLLPVLVTFDELRILYRHYQLPPSRVAALIRTNSLLLNAMQLVITALSQYQRTAVVDMFDTTEREQAIAWLLSDRPSHHPFGIQRTLKG